MLLVRRVGSIVLMIAAGVVWITMGPQETTGREVTSHSRSISQVMEEDELNNTRTQGAPQQQVVNGWTARDLLSIIAEQQNDIIEASDSEDQRIPALLTLAVIGIGLLGVTADASPTSGPAISSPADGGPEAAPVSVESAAGSDRARDVHHATDPGFDVAGVAFPERGVPPA